MAIDGSVLSTKSLSILLGNVISTPHFLIPIYENENKDNLEEEVSVVENCFFNMKPIELCLKLQLFGYNLKL